MFLLFVLVVIFLTPHIIKYIKFNKSEYPYASGNSYLKTIKNKGDNGEYLIFSQLESLEGYKRIMTGLYLPKKDGKTTEVDVVMISKTGIYVFESKNYSGWIYGNENYKDWTQTFERGSKYPFYNPIWQNKGHITALENVLELENPTIYRSYIVFSERCELKDIKVTSSVKVIKRNDLMKSIKKDISNSSEVLTIKQVNNIYSKLAKYQLVDESVKKKHIENIERKLNNKHF